MTVENCYVADWTGPAAIVSRGAPLAFFDNVFKHSAEKVTALLADKSQKVLSANNTVIGGGKLIGGTPQVTEVKIDNDVLPLDENNCFMPDSVALPAKLFDVKADFGAKGDGVTDDTGAVLNAVAAARQFRNDATVYFPRGRYRITRTIELTGGNYRLGGSGVFSKVLFDGKPEADAINITPDGNLRIENLLIARNNLSLRPRDNKGQHSGGLPVWTNDVVCTGADIRQNPSANGSRCTYSSVYVSGKYAYMPFELGLRLSNLKAHVRPVARLGAAGSGVDRKVEIVAVELAGEEAHDLHPVERLEQPPVGDLGLLEEPFVLFGKLQGDRVILDLPFDFTIGLKQIPAGGETTDRALRGLLVVPEIRRGHLLFQFRHLGFAVVDVQKLVKVFDPALEFAFRLAQFVDAHHFLAFSSFHISSSRCWMSSRQAPQAPPALQ